MLFETPPSFKMESSSITLPSDDEGKEDCTLKIINTVSLQGCSEVFSEEKDNDAQSILYPECQIKEEEGIEDIKTEPFEHGLSNETKFVEEQTKKEKKRVNLTHLSKTKQEKDFRPKASTSRRDDVVDAKGLALQESLFKTKELFDTFLRVCQDHENTEQMERVVEKLGRAYSAAKQEYLGSIPFQNILEAETEKVNTSNTKPWLNMKLVLDELKHNKKSTGSKLKLGESEESQDNGGSNDDEPIIECPKKRRHLRKLEKVLRAINLKIKKLEEQEVDWEKEDNSAYCKLDRYRAQFTKIYAKICEIKGKLADADRPYLRKVSFAGTTYPHINRCIEKYYNKHREFPDFQDIKKLVTLALKQEGIEMPPIKVHSMAAAAFKEFGEMLKRLRQYDDYDILISYLEQQVDPARDDQELQEQLNRNALLFKKKEQEVIDKFAEKESMRDLSSESDEYSDSKPKKKKKKIINSNPSPKKKSSSPVKTNLFSDGSDEENNRSRPNGNFCLSSGSSNSESDSEKKVKDKGKSLVGKKRIVKRGVKKSSTVASELPKTALSSEDETVPVDAKESLTSYLGLKVTSAPQSASTKELKTLSDSEDEIMCINEILKPPRGTQNKNRTSDNSDSEKNKNPNFKTQSGSNIRSNQSNSSKSNDKDIKILEKIHSDGGSDSDITICEEPKNNNSKPKKRIENNVKKAVNQARKSTGPKRYNAVSTKVVFNTNQTDTHENISDSSESESRTSDEESENEKKSISDLELSTKDLSSDSSDDDEKAKDDKPDAPEPIVILSEEVIEESKPANPKPKPQEESSDSDDICILSQVERRTVAPRKMKPDSNPVSSPIQRVVTSTPIKVSKPQMKRRLSNHSSNERSAKMQKQEVTHNSNSKQSTLPQVINGAARKVIISRVAKPGSDCKSIPIIELD